MIRALAAACFALLLLSFSARADDGCAKDTDCKGSRICVDHACIDAPAVQSCARDTDCPGDDVCEQKICVPPAPVKKGKAKPGKRDLVKEAQQKAAAHRAAERAAQQAAAPEPVAAPAPEANQPPVAPPQLIQAAPPPASAPVKAEPVAPAPQPEPAHVQAAPAPAPAASTPPPPPPDLITAPPPPLVAAAPPPASTTSTSSEPPAPDNDYPRFLWGAGVTAGIHSLSSTNSETDFGVDGNGDFGIRITDNLGVELMVQVGFSPMLSSGTDAAPISHSGLLGAVGLGVRLDHLGPIPGHFLIGGMGSALSISSSDGSDALNLSGGAVLLQYAMPIAGPFEASGQMGIHFLSDGFTLFTLSAGIAFGN